MAESQSLVSIMDSEEGSIYKSPCVVWHEKSLLLYGSGKSLFAFDYKASKLSKRVDHPGPNQYVRSIHVDAENELIVVGFDDKSFTLYDESFNSLLTRTFGKKISFIASAHRRLVICDLFGDVSALQLDLEAVKAPGNEAPDQKSNNFKILVPFSHYSTITSSLIFDDLLFTGNKDGKIVANSVTDLHEIRDMYLSHKMSISSLSVSDPEKLLISLSIDNSIRLWSLETGLEVCRILLMNSNCLQYHLSCNHSQSLIVVLLLNELLVIRFDFNHLKIESHRCFKLPFTSQTCTFISNDLYLVDHDSNLHRADLEQLPSSHEGGSEHAYESEVTENGNKIKVARVPVTQGTRLLATSELYRDELKTQGMKINIKKHVNLD